MYRHTRIVTWEMLVALSIEISTSSTENYSNQLMHVEVIASLYYFVPSMGAKYCEQRDCLSLGLYVCPPGISKNSLHFTKFSVHVTHGPSGRGSVLL